MGSCQSQSEVEPQPAKVAPEMPQPAETAPPINRDNVGPAGDENQFFREFLQAQLAGYKPMHLDFDASELTRKAVDDEYVANLQVSTEVESEVWEAVKNVDAPSDERGFRGYIAAQFKNSHMKSSTLSCNTIEALLTRIVQTRKFDSPECRSVIWYNDRSGIYDDGVRFFKFHGKDPADISEEEGWA